MTKSHRCLTLLAAASLSLILAACGGGNGDSSPAPSAASQQLAQQSQAPSFTSNSATDAFNWFNYRRRQAGLPADLNWSPEIALAAQRHADYQRLNGTPSARIMHEEVFGAPGFSGIYDFNRLIASKYSLSSIGNDINANGEVISYMSDPSGFVAAEELIAAIYHRFVIFEPLFRDAGAGSAKDSTGATILNVNFGSRNGLPAGLGVGNHIVYPYPGQQSIPTAFASDTEKPDPVPNANIVGYPISILTNYTECITTTSFTVMPRSGGAPLPIRRLTYDEDVGPASDPRPTPRSAAAIIPLSPLAANTTYDVSFTGNISAPIDYYDPSRGCVGGTPFTHGWSFTTR